MKQPEGYLTVRPMRQGDLAEVARIESCSYTHPWSPEMLLEELEREVVSRSYVLERAGGGVVGYLMAWYVADELHVTNVAVHPDHRGKGCGRRLMEHALAMAVAEGGSWCALEVRPTNRTALALYRSLGFRPLGTRRGYYSDGEDAVVLAVDLGPLAPPETSG